MLCSAGVDVNRGSPLGEPPRRPGVVEVDVGEEHVPHVVGRVAQRLQTPFQCAVGRVRAGLDQDRPYAGLYNERRRGSRDAVV